MSHCQNYHQSDDISILDFECDLSNNTNTTNSVNIIIYGYNEMCMGEGDKKSFWTSIPGILTGLAAVIVAVGSILGALHIIPTPTTTSTTPIATPSSSPTSTPVTSTTSSSEAVCGTQLPGVDLFGSWTWIGTNNGATQSGIVTFKDDCTYTGVAKSGFTANDEGHFVVGSSPVTIKLQNKLGNEHNYLVTQITNKSFQLSDLDNKVSLNFVRSS
jgi:hypothetical protein